MTRVIVFDVNETLLDVGALDPLALKAVSSRSRRLVRCRIATACPSSLARSLHSRQLSGCRA